MSRPLIQDAKTLIELAQLKEQLTHATERKNELDAAAQNISAREQYGSGLQLLLQKLSAREDAVSHTHTAARQNSSQREIETQPVRDIVTDSEIEIMPEQGC